MEKTLFAAPVGSTNKNKLLKLLKKINNFKSVKIIPNMLELAYNVPNASAQQNGIKKILA